MIKYKINLIDNLLIKLFSLSFKYSLFFSFFNSIIESSDNDNIFNKILRTDEINVE